MAYTVPSVLINQEFTQVPVFADQPLSALIFGPQYNLYRYGVAAEKPTTEVINPDGVHGNAYQDGTDVTYPLPGQVAGTYVDASYVEVFFEKAQVVYYPNDIADTAGAVTRLIGPNGSTYYPNRFKATDLVFATANNVSRSADFASRDVQLGDVVTISSTGAAASFTTSVKALHYSLTAASLGSVTADSGNAATVSGSIGSLVSTGTLTNVTVAVKAGSAYTGGYTQPGTVGAPILTDTYTVKVTTGGNLTAVRFSVSSASGSVSATNVAITDTDFLVVDTTSPNNVELDFTGSTAFVTDNVFTIPVVAAINAAEVPTAAGTYAGQSNTTYKLTVVRGGPFYDATLNTGAGNASICARIAITSTGLDSSATVNVQESTSFAVGSYGVTASFSSGPVTDGLLTGDIYYIPATAAAPAATNIIETYDSLPADLLAGTHVDWAITSLNVLENYQVSPLIPNNDVDFNWTVDPVGQTITINEGITTTIPGIVSGGQSLQLDVIAANIFVQHRDLVVTNSVAIASLTDPTTVAAALGTVTPDNPLAQGVYNALLNSNGVPVYYCAVATNDLNGYNAVLALASKSIAYYGLVPLTYDVPTQEAVVAHVNAMSTPQAAKWRVAWLTIPLVPTALVYNEQINNSDWLGTVTADPLAPLSPPTYTLLTVAGATFLTDGIRPTDQLFINFRTDAQGNVAYDTYTVASVRTQTTLVLTAGPGAAINVATKIQINRVYTTDEQVNQLAAQAAAYNNRRVRVVFPDKVSNAGIPMCGFQLGAALAGLRSGVVPHAGLTNTQVLGFDTFTETVITFSDTQLNVLAGSGVWIVTQTVLGATPYVRHQLTTASTSLNTSEDSITTNVDSISRGLMIALEPFIGVYNINTGSILMVRKAMYNELNYRLTSTYVARAGNQLNGFTINSLAPDTTFQDQLDANITLVVPYPLNKVNITLVV